MNKRNHKKIILFWIACQVIALSLLFSPIQPIRAKEQQTITPESTITGSTHGVVPMEGRASGSIGALCHPMCFSSVCPTAETYERSYNFTVTFWIVGKIGGDHYKDSFTTYVGVGDNLECSLYGRTMVSDFEGGPNDSVAGNGDLWKMKLVNGDYFELTFNGFSAYIPVENPEIFDGWVESEIAPESTEELLDTPIPLPTEEVFSIPTLLSGGDCLNDPLNADGCMSTPFVRQRIAAVIGVGATLATILVSLLGGAATATGEAAAGAAAGAANGEAAALAAVGAATSVASITPSAIVGAAGIPASQAPSPKKVEPTSGKMTQAEFRILVNQRTDFALRAQQLNREEQEWRHEWRRIYDLLDLARTRYNAHVSKITFAFGKDVLEWTPLSPVGPAQVVGKLVEKIAGQVADIVTKPPSKGVTDAQILEHDREIIRLLKEKMEEAKKNREDINREKQDVLQRINEIDNRIKDNPVILPY